MLQERHESEYRRYLARAGGIVAAVLIGGSFTVLIAFLSGQVIMQAIAGAAGESDISALRFGAGEATVSYGLVAAIAMTFTILTATAWGALRVSRRWAQPEVIDLSRMELAREELDLLHEIHQAVAKPRTEVRAQPQDDRG